MTAVINDRATSRVDMRAIHISPYFIFAVENMTC